LGRTGVRVAEGAQTFCKIDEAILKRRFGGIGEILGQESTGKRWLNAPKI